MLYEIIIFGKQFLPKKAELKWATLAGAAANVPYYTDSQLTILILESNKTEFCIFSFEKHMIGKAIRQCPSSQKLKISIKKQY